jgi:hypothetical protein
MVEKAPLFGGTTAYSAGVVWIPVNAAQRVAGLTDSRQAALEYLAHHVGNRLDRARAEPSSTMRRPCSTASRARDLPSFRWCRPGPTITPTSRGPRRAADRSGRRPSTAPSRELFFPKLRAPLKTMMAFGGMMIGRNDLPHIFQMSRSLKTAAHVGRMLTRYARDRLTHPRGTRLVNGNALIARMAAAAIARGKPLWLSSPVAELHQAGGALSAPSSTRWAKPLR